MSARHPFSAGHGAPLGFVRERLGFHPEPQQLPVFDPAIRRGILCCNRQWGKSTTIAALAVYRAWCLSPALILVIAPILPRAKELILKIKGFLGKLGVQPKGDGICEGALLLPNGSRIVPVTADEDTIRGFSSVSMILVDEAARVDDATFSAVTPSLARSNGIIWLLSTPNGRQGFFHDIWHNGRSEWTRIHSTVEDCPNIPADFLASERAAKSEAEFNQEFYCVFQDTDDQYFASADIADAFSDEVDPLRNDPALWSRTADLHHYIGIDLGKFRDHTAIVVLERRVVNTGQRDPASYDWIRETTRHVRHLERLPLRTPYDEVVRRIAALVAREPLPGRSTLVVDATGAGAPVVDYIRKAGIDAGLVSVAITGGDHPSHAQGVNHVPKVQLISSLQLHFQNRTLKIANGLHEARVLRKELTDMRASSPHHGDLAMALALAAWQTKPPRPFA